MDTTSIVLILAAVVAVSILAIVVVQLREKAKIQRLRKISALADTYKRAQTLLEEVPEQYLTPDLKLLLIQRMESTCKDLLPLKSDKPVAEWLEHAQQLKQKVDEGEDKRAPSRIDSPEKANNVKESLKSLFKVIEGMHKAGQIDKAVAQRKLKYLLFLVHKTNADLHIFQAREHIKQNAVRKAIHEYHLASTEMGKSKDNPLATKAIKSIRIRIKELEVLANEGQELKTADAEQSRRDKEWDSFLDDDSWKKKADYDD
ncbi:hypothetical protein [Marinobacter zhejiangensis]|uniref:DNA phosphorothioation-dependent restriction protein DptG n=1 Tax=Marinobacter zhejiangensis TaxID=488535 RepID=A0A1I4RGW2_9GAMM|nr:hypothetical protein [Marinobacter zhejiangensis]SFM51494.1 hypothetical protein SAMN04487963_2755 [Marinobacter zhejiangensis]